MPLAQVGSELYNLKYADWEISEKGKSFDPNAAAYYPIVVEQKTPRDFCIQSRSLDRVLSKRSPGQACEIRYGNGHGYLKKYLGSFFETICRKVPYVEQIQTIRYGSFQESSFSPVVGQPHIIEGRRTFKKTHASLTMVFHLFTTCRSDSEQQLLVDHLTETFP